MVLLLWPSNSRYYLHHSYLVVSLFPPVLAMSVFYLAEIVYGYSQSEIELIEIHKSFEAYYRILPVGILMIHRRNEQYNYRLR